MEGVLKQSIGISGLVHKLGSSILASVLEFDKCVDLLARIYNIRNCRYNYSQRNLLLQSQEEVKISTVPHIYTFFTISSICMLKKTLGASYNASFQNCKTENKYTLQTVFNSEIHLDWSSLGERNAYTPTCCQNHLQCRYKFNGKIITIFTMSCYNSTSYFI